MTRSVKGLPDRYFVGWSIHKQKHYLDDGSNFAMWLDDKATDAEIIKLATDHRDAAIRRRNEIWTSNIAAMKADPEGWRHSSCDHAYGICCG